MPHLDERFIDGARRAIAEHGVEGLTLARIATASGVSRMTLHRRGVTKEAIRDALADELVGAYRNAFWPSLTSPGRARDRLRAALLAQCRLEEEYREVLEAVAAREREAIYHEPEGGGVLTRDVFVAPLRRLLEDGRADGSLRKVDAEETATVLFNLVSWTYHHLRVGHRWPPERAERAVVDVALDGVRA